MESKSICYSTESDQRYFVHFRNVIVATIHVPILTAPDSAAPGILPNQYDSTNVQWFVYKFAEYLKIVLSIDMNNL